LDQALDQIVSCFGQSARAKLGSAAVQGEPEDQLRAPFVQLPTCWSASAAGPPITQAALAGAGAFFPAGHSSAAASPQTTLEGFDEPPAA
jgi:hypothetical protein